jgi:integrase
MALKKLTTRYCETVQAVEGQKRLEVRDADVRGLEFRVGASGAKSWVLRYRRAIDRQKRILTLGTFPGMSLGEARTLAAAHKVQITIGADPANQAQVARKAETFGEVVSEWRTRYAEIETPRSLPNDNIRLAAHVIPVMGRMKARQITRGDIESLVDAVSAKPDGRVKNKAENEQAKGASKPKLMVERSRQVYFLVRKIIRWAIKKQVGAMTTDPTLGFEVDEAAKPRKRHLSADEICIVWQWLNGTRERTLYSTRAVGDMTPRMDRSTALASMLSLVTGQRIGECTGIRKAELSLNGLAPIWTIPEARTKNKKEHRVPLSPLAVHIINEALTRSASSDYLFPAPRAEKITKRAINQGSVGKVPGAIDPHAAARALARSRHLIDVEAFTLHDFRRTAASQMAKLKVDDRMISRVLNHTVAGEHAMTGGTYVQYPYDDEKRAALEAWAARLERIITGQDASHNVVTLATGTKTDGRSGVTA